MSGAATTFKEITTDIPARMDRLPWSNFHLLVVIALGVTWVLDGLEVTLVGSIGPILRDKQTLSLTDQDIGNIAACYVGGAVVGALLFGWLTDRFGRRLIFNLTLGIYMVGVLLTAFAWNFWSFACFNCITGLGIGGEYAAINSAIDELIPARLRGRIDLIVNGSYWAGRRDRRRRITAIAVGPTRRSRYRLAPRLRHRRGAQRLHPVPAPLSCPRARAGRSPMAARKKPSKPPARSSERSVRIFRRRKTR